MSKSVPFIDTNVFLRFLILDTTTPTLSKNAKKIFEQIQNKKTSVQTNICMISELVYVLEGYYEMDKTSVVQKIMPLIALESLVIENKEHIVQTLYVYEDKRVDFEDAYTYVTMQNAGEHSIYTFDKKHFKRFEDITILD